MSTLAFEALGDAPASVVRSLEDATVEKLVAVVKRADIAGKRSWMLQAIAVGVVQERSRYGEAGVRTASEALGINKKSGERFARVFRDIIRPRVDRMGDRARFPLAAPQWYLVACSAAAAGGRPALELLEIAEAKREKDRRYSAVRFRRELAGETREPALVTLLRKLGRARRVERVAAFVDLADVEAAAAVLEQLRSAIAAARRAA